MFLIDNNLPPSLVGWLAAHGLESLHLKSIGLTQATDTEVWRYAQASKLALLTKDDDFTRFALQSRVPAQPVFRFCIGNATNDALFQWLAPRLDQLLAYQDSVLEKSVQTWPPIMRIE